MIPNKGFIIVEPSEPQSGSSLVGLADLETLKQGTVLNEGDEIQGLQTGDKIYYLGNGHRIEENVLALPISSVVAFDKVKD